MQSRAYTSETDLTPLIDFARRLTADRRPRATYWHAGDIVWLLYAGIDIDPSSNIRLWEDGERLVGAAWFEPPDYVQFDLDRRADLDFAGEMLAWAEQRCRDSTSNGELTLTATAFESHYDRIDVLDRNGYARTERHAARMRRSLDTAVEPPALPSGMRLRHATDDDIHERVDVHRDAWSVWGPSRVTAEAYRRLLAAPVYDQELDIVLETEDGTFASYCIVWPDYDNGIGYFEPVGTRPSFAGQGVARLVIFEALRRLRQRGLHTAIVQTASINPRALALYQACGFEIIERESWYEKKLLSE